MFQWPCAASTATWHSGTAECGCSTVFLLHHIHDLPIGGYPSWQHWVLYARRPSPTSGCSPHVARRSRVMIADVANKIACGAW
jgi:hypothetical protein